MDVSFSLFAFHTITMKTTIYKGYKVDSDGNIYRKNGNGLLKPFRHDKGYTKVTMEGKNIFTHKVIWEAFNSTRPEGMTIDHINGIKTDNRLENLQLLTPEENAHKSNKKDGLPLNIHYRADRDCYYFCKETNGKRYRKHGTLEEVLEYKENYKG